MLHIRRPLARAVPRLSAASPRVVALDVILADAGDPPKPGSSLARSASRQTLSSPVNS